MSFPLWITSRQSLDTAVGLTHASSVMPVVRSSELASGTLTRLLVPLNDSAPPYLPLVDQVVFDVVPTLPLPEKSVTDATAPSLNEYAATIDSIARSSSCSTRRR